MSSQSPRVGHVYTPIPGFRKSIALLSEATQENVDRAIIFVHGFDGSAKHTWADFLSLIDSDDTASRWWETADLYLYHYLWKSMFQKVGRTKLDVLRFIKSVFPTPSQAIFDAGSVSLRRSFSYKELTLVGHSEGGLLVRKLLVDAAAKDPQIRRYINQSKAGSISATIPQPVPSGILKAQTRLFAPAIGGETITGFLGMLLRAPIVSTITSSIPAKLSLSPTSAAITATRHSTEKFSSYLSMDCFDAHIMWADNDSIVEPEKYDCDFECENPTRGTSHGSVCKPRKYYLQPIDFVEKGVIDGEC